jgi:hypothetical protein
MPTAYQAVRNDLADAFASVDWAASRFQEFAQQITEWLEHNVGEATVKPLPADVPNDVVVVHRKEPLPLFFHVEVGAYINAMRSALDLLATSLAHRFDMPMPDEMSFPIADSRESFVARKFRGRGAKRFFERLPNAERRIIESIEPYKGGNQLLWALHELDNKRKHRRLLDVAVHPRRFGISAADRDFFTPVATGWVEGVDGELVLGLLKKGTRVIDMKFVPHVMIDEPGGLGPAPIDQALDRAAHLVRSIIIKFDTH